MKYSELFQIEIIHPYFSGTVKDLVMVADKETKIHLNSQGYILKKEAGGIKVLTPFNTENESFQSLGDDNIFTFYIYPISAHIQEITDLTAIENGNMISFTNLGQPMDSSELIRTQVEKHGVFRGFPALANVIITRNKINTETRNEVPKFKAVFKAKSIKWKYYFVSESQVLNISVESRDAQISFDEVVIENATADPVIQSLQLNFPNTQIRAFKSRDLVPYSSKPLKNIKLLQNGDVLINHLPNPQKEQQGIQIIKIN